MNKKAIEPLFFLIFLLYFSPLSSFAQTRCPVGGQVGSAQCLPDEDGAAPPRPTGEWIKTWGALVSSNKAGGAWSSKGKFTENEARQDALNRCYSTGVSDCSVDATYFNQCIAAAASNELGVDFNTGKDEGIAGKRALSDCEKRSKSICSVKFTECTDPIFRKY
ncbi:DUF4189 domain-containing protein [Xanthomonas hyacinthi]|uniref:DUF4189 domain-containing protein n=1 Tax=Xanthomonas hyacinthi TaxID=56455 RepID=A0A2S7EN77_9XANT|nr:DUF4189 domain-containing protein [Xanthomonas hyacinthi]PPU92699.1 hypothetical protein XhyaCFBP1156_20980 [Xanthomonas hyacinthi]QGY75221.1 DUF4189 domain-containing protein [Xanthomonas hyacinthi]